MNARRPEIRWAEPAHPGVAMGSLPYTHTALSTCVTPNRRATLASHTFIEIVDEKNRVNTSSWLGSCTRP